MAMLARTFEREVKSRRRGVDGARRGLAFCSLVLALLQSGAVLAQAVDPPLAYPQAGTVIQTTTATLRIENVNGPDALVRTDRNAPVQVHGHFMRMSGAGMELKYPRKELESLWPLRVGKSVKFTTSRGNGVWESELRVVRTERVRVPAGEFDTYVIEHSSRGIGGPGAWRAIETEWYAPALSFVVKYARKQLDGIGTGDVSWELVQVVPVPAAPRPGAVRP